MRGLIRRFDAFLRRAYGVFEFCQDPDCLLRLQATVAAHPVHLPGLEVRAGEPVVGLHLWNEHLPIVPPEGADLGWATRTARLWVYSLRLAARHVQQDPRLAAARAIVGVTALLDPAGQAASVKLMQRLGFTVLPYHSPLGRFGEFWENFYSWWVIWAYNPASLRNRRLFHMHRAEIWMARDEFLDRYG